MRKAWGIYEFVWIAYIKQIQIRPNLSTLPLNYLQLNNRVFFKNQLTLSKTVHIKFTLYMIVNNKKMKNIIRFFFSRVYPYG